MKKTIFIIYCVLICATGFSQPTITSFSPISGAVGSSVTLTGTGFNSIANQNIVFFGATKATVTAATTTSLEVTVPLGATYQYISVTNLSNSLTSYSARPFVVTLVGNINFSPKVDFTTGIRPSFVSIGDIDGDGKPDLIIANRTTGTVSTFRNTTSVAGTVSFATKVDFQTGNEPMSLDLGDIDGDGKLDLAVANYGSTTVSVLRNTSTTGMLSFATKVDFPASTCPNSIKIGDIDGDGKSDLTVANRGASTISVFRNTSTVGAISFVTRVNFTAGNQPNMLSIGDLDGDGKIDVAVANYLGTNLSVFRNTSTIGTVSFATKVDFTTGSIPYLVCIGDLDGNGKLDLAVTNYNSNTVSVLRNTSVPGTISFATKVDFPTGAGPASMSICDIDGDRSPDLAVTNYNVASLSVLRNTSVPGTISFAAKVDYTAGIQPQSINIGDIDGDEHPDLIASNYSGNNISFFHQITNGVAVLKTENKNELSIYPNPFSSQTTLAFSNVLTDATLIVYNPLGQQVKQMQNISGNMITLERGVLTNGQYFIQILEDNKIIAIKKIMIAN